MFEFSERTVAELRLDSHVCPMTAVAKSGLGAIGWCVFVGLRVTDMRDDAWAHALLVFAALVLVPLAWELLGESDEAEVTERWLRFAGRLQLPAALLLALACGLAPGAVAVLAAFPWVVLTGLLAWIGIRRIKREGLRRSLDGLCTDIALVFAAVGGAWVLIDRSGYSLLGFSAAVITLTAVHFHYAGLLLPLLAGRVQRELFFFRFASQAAVGVVLGVPAVAVGITATQLGWGTSLEAAAGCGLALAGMAVAVLHVRIALETRRDPLTRVLLGVAGASLFFAMTLAGLYAMRTSSAALPWLGIPQMRMVHGSVNALGFGLCGVLAWRRMGSAPATG